LCLGTFSSARAACAGLVALSTLFTRQHYILDVVAGFALAYAAYVVFLRSSSRDDVRLSIALAPTLAVDVAALVVGMITGYWTVYRIVAA